jgi:hypothetical protein
MVRTLQCGRLLPLLRPKPSLANHTQGGSAPDGVAIREPALAEAAGETEKLNISLALLEGYRRWQEQWLPHDSWYLLAVSAQARAAKP